MGIQGTEVAKEASDIILMDDNFTSIVKAVSWGRNVYDSIRKFLQFQLTVNVVAVSLAFIGAVTNEHGESPLKPVQLLWVNLIMDTMAALALATDSPAPELLERRPYGKDDPLITRRMWLNIFGQAIFQLCVNLTVLYGGDVIFGVTADSVEHRTLIFNIFVLCQVFNEINCRKLGQDFNVFNGLFTNHICMAVLFFTVLMQFGMVQFGGEFTSTFPLSLQQWLICTGIGAISLPVGFLLRLIPIKEPDPETNKKSRVPVLTRKESVRLWGKVKSATKMAAVINYLKHSPGYAESVRRKRRLDTTEIN
jgi:calcium-translocating P-type ATPase